jgi:hypothetical protein
MRGPDFIARVRGAGMTVHSVTRGATQRSLAPKGSYRKPYLYDYVSIGGWMVRCHGCDETLRCLARHCSSALKRALKCPKHHSEDHGSRLPGSTGSALHNEPMPRLGRPTARRSALAYAMKRATISSQNSSSFRLLRRSGSATSTDVSIDMTGKGPSRGIRMT